MGQGLRAPSLVTYQLHAIETFVLWSQKRPFSQWRSTELWYSVGLSVRSLWRWKTYLRHLKALHIKNMLELLIEHYPNHLGIIKQLKLVCNNIDCSKGSGSPFNDLKAYYQVIHNLSKKLGGLEPVREYKYLGHRTSKEKPTASGTWFLLHFISVKENFKCISSYWTNINRDGPHMSADLATIGTK